MTNKHFPVKEPVGAIIEGALICIATECIPVGSPVCLGKESYEVNRSNGMVFGIAVWSAKKGDKVLVRTSGIMKFKFTPKQISLLCIGDHLHSVNRVFYSRVQGRALIVAVGDKELTVII